MKMWNTSLSFHESANDKTPKANNTAETPQKDQAKIPESLYF